MYVLCILHIHVQLYVCIQLFEYVYSNTKYIYVSISDDKNDVSKVTQA